MATFACTLADYSRFDGYRGVSGERSLRRSSRQFSLFRFFGGASFEEFMLRPVQVKQHVNFMQARGFLAEDIVAGTGIDPSRLSDVGYLVTVQQCHAVVANMMRLTGNSGIGLEVGSATKVNDLGILGYAMASANTLRQAIGLWVQYGNSPVGFPFTLKMFESPHDKHWGVTAANIGISGSVYRFYVEETLAMGLSFGQLLTDQPFELAEVCFSFPAPPHVNEYERRFNCPLVFSAPITRALVKSPVLTVPVTTNDSELRELCVRHCSHLVKHISRSGPMSYRLRSALMSLGRIPTLEEAAEALSVSPRSLRRHLQGEGTGFQQVLDAFRTDLAREYLSTGMMPAKEVAFLLGFSKVDAFRRAFKTWTGQTVRGFQSPSHVHR